MRVFRDDYAKTNSQTFGLFQDVGHFVHETTGTSASVMQRIQAVADGMAAPTAE